MNFSKQFFEECKKAKFDAFEYRESEEKSLTIKYQNGKLLEKAVQKDCFIVVRVQKGDKIAISNVNVKNKDSLNFIMNNLKFALTLSNKKANSIYRGSDHYVLYDPFNKALALQPIKEKEKAIKVVHKTIKDCDKRIKQVIINYAETEFNETILNNYGLKLHDHSNNYFYSVIVDGNDGESIKSSYSYFYENDLEKFNPKKFGQDCAKKLIKLFNPIKIKDGLYPIVLNQECCGELLSNYCDSLSSEDIQKGISKFTNKLNKRIASDLITIEEHSLDKNIFFSGYDSELVSKRNQTFIEKGILKQLAYNRQTASIDKTSSTGNGRMVGSKVGIGFNHLYLKPGEKSFAEMISHIKCGIYIIDMAGFNSSFNNHSGHFSLKCSGFLIQNGKITKPIKEITIAGNLFDIFLNIKGVSNDLKILPDSTEVPSILISQLRVATE